MNIGIIGSGNVGKALGETWLKKDHEVLFSYSRDLQKLRAYTAGLGGKASAGTPAEAVKFGEVVLFAPPWPSVEDALRAAGPLKRKILIAAFLPPGGDLAPSSLATSCGRSYREYRFFSTSPFHFFPTVPR